jgi:hypothetical protein
LTGIQKACNLVKISFNLFRQEEKDMAARNLDAETTAVVAVDPA